VFCTRCGASIADNSVFCPSCGATVQRPPSAAQPVAGPPPIAGTPPVPPAPYGFTSVPVAPLPYASWGSRVLAYIIDMLIVLVLVIPLALIAGIMGMGGAMFHSLAPLGHVFGSGCCCALALFPVVQIAFGIYNRIYLPSIRGYSIGQGVAKIKLVDAFGNLLPQSTLWLRLLVQVLLGMVPVVGWLDLLWPLWDERRQTLHDKAVNSYVIDFPPAVAMP